MFIQSKGGRQYSFSVDLSSKEINEQLFAETISFFDKTLHKEKDVREIEYSTNIDIPARVFREGNNGLRAIVKFLKEEKKLTFARIAKILDRDQRTIWTAYNSTLSTSNSSSTNKKKQEKIPRKNNSSKLPELTINSSVFANRNFSVLENAAISLLKSHSVKETAQILGRNEMTIWTVKRRADLKTKQMESRDKNKRTAK